MTQAAPQPAREPSTASEPKLIAFMPALFVLLWATGFIGAKYGVSDAEPLTFLAYRFALAALLLFLLCLATRAPWPASKAEAFHSMVAGSLIHGFYLGATFTAVWLGLPPALAALIAGLQPVATSMLAGPFLGERITGWQWLGTLLGLAGLVLVLFPKLLDPSVAAASLTWPMLACAFGSLIGITIGTLYQKAFAADAGLRAGGVFQYLGAFVIVAIGATLFESWQINWTPEVIGAMVWLVIVLSIGAISLLMVLIRHGAVSKVANLFYLVPPVAAIMAFALFGDRLTTIQIVGMAITAFAVWLASRPTRH